MLSYQHEYHAGNHADILKHICLCLILENLTKKEKPFTVIDTHAGAGRFDLNDERLLKTGEAHEGIEKLFTACNSKTDALPHGLSLYLKTEGEYLKNNIYAGSPELERYFMRRGDTLHLIEKHPASLASLSDSIKLSVPAEKKSGFCTVKVHDADSYTTLNALVPPLVKRGLIICDPSYEDASDYKSVTAALENARKKWNTAIIVLWYPLLERRKNETAQMLSAIEIFGKTGTNPCESFRCELEVKDPAAMREENGAHLYGSGIFVMNPPWHLEEDMREVSDYLKKKLIDF